MTTAWQPPHAAALSLAMVQGAVYDAVNAIDGGHQPYLVAPPAAGTPRSRCRTAAFRVLVGFRGVRAPPLGLGPSAAVRPCSRSTTRRSAAVPDGPAKAGGIAVGEAAAAAMLAAGRTTAAAGCSQFVDGTDPGRVAARATAGSDGNRRS